MSKNSHVGLTQHLNHSCNRPQPRIAQVEEVICRGSSVLKDQLKRKIHGYSQVRSFIAFAGTVPNAALALPGLPAQWPTPRVGNSPISYRVKVSSIAEKIGRLAEFRSTWRLLLSSL